MNKIISLQGYRFKRSPNFKIIVTKLLLGGYTIKRIAEQFSTTEKDILKTLAER